MTVHNTHLFLIAQLKLPRMRTLGKLTPVVVHAPRTAKAERRPTSLGVPALARTRLSGDRQSQCNQVHACFTNNQ